MVTKSGLSLKEILITTKKGNMNIRKENLMRSVERKPLQQKQKHEKTTALF